MKSAFCLVSTHRLTRDGRDLQLVEIAALRLKVLRGGDAGLQRTVSDMPVRIGKAPDCDLVLTDSSVSRAHVRLSLSGEGLVVEDLGSKNGTFSGAVRVKEAVVALPAELRLGETVLLVALETDQRYAVVGEEEQLGELVGRSRAIRETYALLRAVAPTASTLVVLGETGTGKEVTVRTLHELSARKGPLVTFDCSVGTPELIQSELFGHQAGAFTGATGPRKGAFVAARDGTLFLDEIGELPLSLQPALLRVLETREVKPLGSDRAVPVSVRLVAATHRNLKEMVDNRSFREDLYHRLGVLRVRLPPLRERPEDVPLLVDHFIRRMGLTIRLEPGAIARLSEAAWPGNVRSLRNVVEGLGALYPARSVTAGDLDRFADELQETLPKQTMEDVERDAILAAIQEAGGNRALAAQRLNIGLSTLFRKLKQYRERDGK